MFIARLALLPKLRMPALLMVFSIVRAELEALVWRMVRMEELAVRAEPREVEEAVCWSPPERESAPKMEAWVEGASVPMPIRPF